MEKEKKKKVKAWIVVSLETKKPARFIREGTPVEWEVFPHKYKANTDFYMTRPCVITYSLPKKIPKGFPKRKIT